MNFDVKNVGLTTLLKRKSSETKTISKYFTLFQSYHKKGIVIIIKQDIFL